RIRAGRGGDPGRASRAGGAAGAVRGTRARRQPRVSGQRGAPTGAATLDAGWRSRLRVARADLGAAPHPRAARGTASAQPWNGAILRWADPAWRLREVTETTDVQLADRGRRCRDQRASRRGR